VQGEKQTVLALSLAVPCTEFVINMKPLNLLPQIGNSQISMI